MTMKTKQKYIEDLLKQETFTLAELRAAKHKHPILSWLKGLYLNAKSFFVSI